MDPTQHRVDLNRRNPEESDVEDSVHGEAHDVQGQEVEVQPDHAEIKGFVYQEIFWL